MYECFGFVKEQMARVELNRVINQYRDAANVFGFTEISCWKGAPTYAPERVAFVRRLKEPAIHLVFADGVVSGWKYRTWSGSTPFSMKETLVNRL